MMLFVILGLFVFTVYAEPGVFYNPPTGGPIHDYSEDPVYTLGQTVQLRWTTTLDSLSIMLWQNNNADYEWVQTDLHDVTSYDWIISTNRNLSNGNVFFQQIRNASNLEVTDQLFASHYFNITESDSATTTTSSSSTSTIIAPSISLAASSTVSQTLTTATSPASTSSPSTNTNTTTNSGLSSEAKTGIGIGVGLGCAFIVALVAVFFYFRRQSSKLVERVLHHNKNNPATEFESRGLPPGNTSSTAELKGYYSPALGRGDVAEVSGNERFVYELQ